MNAMNNTSITLIYSFWATQAYQMMTVTMMITIRRLPTHIPMIAAIPKPDSPCCIQAGLHTFIMVAVWFPMDINFPVALSWNIWIRVDAVRFPLSVEYTTVVMKVRVLRSAEQVARDSSRLERLKLHKQISWIASATPVSIESFYRKIFGKMHSRFNAKMLVQL